VPLIKKSKGNSLNYGLQTKRVALNFKAICLMYFYSLQIKMGFKTSSLSANLVPTFADGGA
jgi:hypothetical protein